MKSKTVAAKGGAYISAGTYGCVFSPPLACEATDNPIKQNQRSIGKLFSDPESSKKEVRDAERIKKFDPEYKFTVPYLGQCITSKRKFTESDEVQKCRKHVDGTRTYFNQVLYGYGGIELTTYITKPENVNVNFDDMLRACLPVLEGIKRMQTQGLMHTDINPNNMLLDNSGPSPRVNLIDFGLMSKLSSLKTRYYVHAHRYPYYPPEFRIFDTRRHGVIDEYELVNACWNNLSSLKLPDFGFWMNSLWPQNVYSYEINNVVRELTELNLLKFEKAFDKIIAPSVDAYSFGMTMLEIAYNLEITKKLVLSSPEFYKNVLSTVILPLVHPNVFKRLTLDEAIVRLSRCINNKSATRGSQQQEVTKPSLASDECMQKTGNELRALLAQHGLPKYGNKTVMCARLQGKIGTKLPNSEMLPPMTPLPPAKNSNELQRYGKLLKDCNKSEALGGYPIVELRAKAKKLGLAHQKIRKEICQDLQQMAVV